MSGVIHARNRLFIFGGTGLQQFNDIFCLDLSKCHVGASFENLISTGTIFGVSTEPHSNAKPPPTPQVQEPQRKVQEQTQKPNATKTQCVMPINSGIS